MGVEITPLGQGFTWMSENIEQDRTLAQACWQQCREKIESGLYDVVILDEITYALKYGWLDIEDYSRLCGSVIPSCMWLSLDAMLLKS